MKTSPHLLISCILLITFRQILIPVYTIDNVPADLHRHQKSRILAARLNGIIPPCTVSL